MYSLPWRSRVINLVAKTLSLILIITFLVTASPRPAQAACALKYTVQSGDTLYKIAATYSVDFKTLAEANKLKEPYLIYVGQVLCIPSGAEIPDTTPGVTGTTTKKVPAIAAIHMGSIAWVGVSNFNKERFYYVKVYAGGWSYWKYPEYQIAYVQTNKSGQFGSWFHLPDELEDVHTVTFCVKDAINDDVIACKIVTNNDYWYDRKSGYKSLQ
ncbi:MAG: LysM peptidoglycan-binding domain-containing protein [Anaerolineales bacterium]|nr:LysM peptidoglycan-binding domain-containing protein [Anaerolineales bacterium]MDD5466212.1 LysM peptidoglycan-binding domain-containing protein [Anaerolineales bacterium]